MKINFSDSQTKKISAKALEALLCGDTRAFNRAKTLELLALGRDSDEIALILNLSLKTISRYIHGFIRWGLGFLIPAKASGRPPKLSKRQMKELKARIKKGPVANGFPGGCWTAAMVAELIYKRYKAQYAASYIPQLLKRMGFSWQKSTTKNYRQDAERLAEWKTTTWPKILRKAKRKNAKIFFEDECSFALSTTQGYTWAPRGEQPIVETTGSRQSLKVFGAIEFYSGRLLAYAVQDQLNGETYTSFLKYALKHTRGKLVWIHDGVAYHKSKEIKEFLKTTDRLELVLLPPYSPELNPIEKLWKKFKQTGTHNRFFKNIGELRKQVDYLMDFYRKNREEVLALMPV